MGNILKDISLDYIQNNDKKLSIWIRNKNHLVLKRYMKKEGQYF